MKLRFAGCVYAAALLIGGATGALAQDKTFELKLSHWVPPSHPLQKALEEWGASVEKNSGGTIKYKVYPAQQLGKAFDHYDMARDGIADLTYINPGYQPGRFPIISAGELPFLMTTAKGGTQALDAGLVSAAQAEGSLRSDIDVRVVERLLFGMINSIVEWYRPGGREDAARLADDVVAVALDGLRMPATTAVD